MDALIRNIAVLALFFAVLADLLALWSFILEEKADKQERLAKQAAEKAQRERYRQLTERLSQLEHQIKELENTPDSPR